MQAHKLIGRGLLTTICCRPLPLDQLKIRKLCGLPFEAFCVVFQDKDMHWKFCIRLSTSLNIRLLRLAAAGNIGSQWYYSVQGIWNLVVLPYW